MTLVMRLENSVIAALALQRIFGEPQDRFVPDIELLARLTRPLKWPRSLTGILPDDAVHQMQAESVTQLKRQPLQICRSSRRAWLKDIVAQIEDQRAVLGNGFDDGFKRVADEGNNFTVTGVPICPLPPQRVWRAGKDKADRHLQVLEDISAWAPHRHAKIRPETQHFHSSFSRV